MRKHLAVFSKLTVEEIFSSHRQVLVWFSQKRIAPFGLVRAGDLVFIKPSGEEITGQFLVKKIVYLEGLDEESWKIINPLIAQDQIHKDIKYATILWIDRVEKFITSPIKLLKSDQRRWVRLEDD